MENSVRENKKVINIIYRAYEKDLDIRDLDFVKNSTNYLTSMRCLELIDFIKIQESKSFSFNIQIMFNDKYNLDIEFFKNVLINQEDIYLYTHGLSLLPEINLLATPIYLIKFNVNPLLH